MSTLLELVGIAAIIAGCFILAGLGAALIAAGAFTVLVGYMRGAPE